MTSPSRPPASRPSTARKVTRKSEERRVDDLDTGVAITLDGQKYEVRIGDLTAPITRELRRHTGGSFQQLMNELAADPDIDSIAAVVWLARRIRGEDLALDDVAISYRQMLEDLDIEVAGREEVDTRNPEA